MQIVFYRIVGVFKLPFGGTKGKATTSKNAEHKTGTDVKKEIDIEPSPCPTPSTVASEDEIVDSS